MTRSPRSLPRTFRAVSPVWRAEGPAELLSALPAFLGFHPQRSLVLVCVGLVGPRQIGPVARCDLPDPGSGPTGSPPIGDAVGQLLRIRPPQAVLVAVDAPAGAPAVRSGPLPWAGLVSGVRLQLRRSGTRVVDTVWAAGTTGGASWRCYGACGCRGVVPDPCATPFAAAAVSVGRVIHRSRAELEELVAPVDAQVLRRRERLIEAAVDALRPGSRARPAQHADAAVAGALVEAAIAESAAGRLTLDDDQVVALAMALSVRAVRDGVIGVLAAHGAGAESAAAAEHLLAALTRECPDPEAAEPAALLAVAALLRGDGVLAGIALDRAKAAWPGHSLTRLLSTAHERGIDPDGLRRALLAGADRSAGAW